MKLNFNFFKRKLFIVTGAVLAATAVAVGTNNFITNDSLSNCSVSDYSNSGEELNFLTIINQYRTQNGLNTLTIDQRLNRAATWMALDLIKNHYFSHTDSLGRSPYKRAQDCGLSSGMGENIAGGAVWDTAEEVFNAWKNSPGHNANMLSPIYKTIGIAREAGGDYGWYWVTDFGIESSVQPSPVVPTNTPLPTNTPTVTNTSIPGATPTATVTSVRHTIEITKDGFNPSTCYLDRKDLFQFHNSTNRVVSVLPGVSTSPFLKTGPLQPGETSKGFNFPFIGSQHFYLEDHPDQIGQIITDHGRKCIPNMVSTPTPVPTATPSLSWGDLSGPTLVKWEHPDLSLAKAPASILNVQAIYHWTGTEWLRWTFGTPVYVKNLTVLEEGKLYWVIPKE